MERYWKVEAWGDFLTWLDEAPAGSEVAYHYGCLATDRQEGQWDNEGRPLQPIPVEPLNSIAEALYVLSLMGQVQLTQRRSEPGVCTYLARKL